MENCIYKIKTLEFDNTIFDSVCDCTYVILCCGDNPHRLPNVMKQINILRPTRYVKLIFNKGYKQCPISISVNNDLVNIQKYVFKDALSRGYKRILFLEDDFQLLKPIQQEYIDEICCFINKNKTNVYSLGNFMIPDPMTLFSHHQRPILNHVGMTHAMFYDNISMKACYDYFHNFKGDRKVLSLDFSLAYVPNISIYRYYKPIIMQLLPETENQKHGWENQAGKVFAYISIKGVKMLGLDKQLQPGFDILYMVPFVLYLLCMIIILLTVKYIYYLNTNNNKNNRIQN